MSDPPHDIPTDAARLARLRRLLADIDDTMAELAREGDVRAAKLVYERLGLLLAEAPPPVSVPSYAELAARFRALHAPEVFHPPSKEQHDETADQSAELLADPADVAPHPRR